MQECVSRTSLRQAGEASGRSAPRSKAIKSIDTDSRLVTVVEHTHALGYAVRLVLTPLDGHGHTIQAELTDPTGSQGSVALTGVTAGQGQGWPESQTTPAATVDHVWNVCC
jgi:hypothetical protein